LRLRAGWPGSLGLVVLPLGHFSSSLNKWIAARRPPTHHIQHVISLPIFWCFFFTKRERYTPGELQRFTVMRVSDSNDEVYKHTHTPTKATSQKRVAKASSNREGNGIVLVENQPTKFLFQGLLHARPFWLFFFSLTAKRLFFFFFFFFFV
jgi:hypothetical protein